MQDETGFEMIFKGEDGAERFGTWLLDELMKVPSSSRTTLEAMTGFSSANILTKNVFFKSDPERG